MGKYMRKPKTAGDMAVMELSQPALGVRTRAKTLALQRLQQKSQPASPAPPTSGSYLQLRSRRLEKPPILMPIHDSKRQRQPGGHKESADEAKENPSTRASSRLRVDSVTSKINGSDAFGAVKNKRVSQRVKATETLVDNEEGALSLQGPHENVDVTVGIEETSFGENVLDVEGRGRTTRESTPCSLIRDPDNIRTPGSTTRSMSARAGNRRIEDSIRRHVPTSHEMDRFFASSEEEHQRQFVEKYNFDPVNEKPLPGRYEWEKLNP